MKLTWREKTDGSWHTRYYPSGEGFRPEPYYLSAHKTFDILPWHWEVKRCGQIIQEGHTTDLSDARLAAHRELAKSLQADDGSLLTMSAQG